MKIIDLSGSWFYRTDEGDEGLAKGFFRQKFDEALKFSLPGSTCDNQIGMPCEWFEEYEKEAVRCPRERYEYVAPLWLQTSFEISEEELLSCDVQLFLERVNISSMLFVDGVQVGREIISLSAPHVYDLTGKMFKLTAGKHTLTLRIDNRDLINFGDMASGYSKDTQGLWNGIIGQICLRLLPKVRIEDVQIHSVAETEDDIEFQVITKCEQHVPMEVKNALLRVSVTLSDGKKLKDTETSFELFTTRERTKIIYSLSSVGAKQVARWNEFSPVLHKAKVELLIDDEVADSFDVEFGLRNPHIEGKKLMLDDRELSLRGTINCAQFPLTGYPPMDEATWFKQMSRIKEYGFNHIRFHAWCPPEAAFEAADRLGIYLLVEMPLWMNRDICPFEVGDDPIHESFYIREARQIRKCYGNHPSFLMFSNGNENMGDFVLLEDIITMLKASDKRCLYTLTSNFDHPVHEAEDFLCSFEMAHTPGRIQFLHDEVAKGSFVNYDEVVGKVNVPLVSFEVGQYCVYPDVGCVKDYTGNMMPVNFDIIGKMMKEKGVYDKLSDYIKASGDMAAKLYKEDIEAVLRTKHFGGIELLSASDYTGQSTATVGILDAFLRDKGVIEKETWLGFCNEVVPLFEAKRIFDNTEDLTGRILLYDFGEKPIDAPVFEVTVESLNSSIDGNKSFETIYEASLLANANKEAALELSLKEFKEPSLLKVSISVEGNNKTYTNSWRVFVYPKEEQCQTNTKSSILSVTELAEKLGREVVDTNYIPVFWSPVFFPSKDSYGAIVENKSKVLSGFPSEQYLDYQWKDLLEHAKGMDISGLEVKPVIEMVPNFVDNTRISPLFEICLEGEKCLACGFDLDRDDIVTKALKKSIMGYEKGQSTVD